MFFNKRIVNTHPGKPEQRGFVLILALVLLAVLTLIGVSSMNSANVELKASANAQQHQLAFNAVQSLLEYAVSSTDPASPPIFDFQTDSTLTQTASTTLADTSMLVADADFAGCAPGVGSSLEEGRGFNYNFFNIAGRGSTATGTSTSLQTQGIRFPAAACK